MGPNSAFVVLIFGLLGIYCELIRPGRIVPGVVGAAATVSGAYFLFQPPFQTSGVTLLGIGILLLIAEALAGPHLLFGSLGTIALTAGFVLLFPAPRSLVPALAIPFSAVLGGATTLLGSSAKRARRMKRADVGTSR